MLFSLSWRCSCTAKRSPETDMCESPLMMPQSSLTRLQKAMYRLSFLAWVLAGTHTNTRSFIFSPQTLIRCAAVICATFSKALSLASLNAQISWRAATASSPALRTLTGKYFKKKSILLPSYLLMLSSIILAIVGKIVCVKLDFLFSLFSEACRLAQGILFRHAKELEGKKTNRKRKIRSICKAHRGRFFEKHP